MLSGERLRALKIFIHDVKFLPIDRRVDMTEDDFNILKSEVDILISDYHCLNLENKHLKMQLQRMEENEKRKQKLREGVKVSDNN